MAKKKQPNQNPPKQKEFHAAPFSSLKGLAVVGVVPPAPVKHVSPEKTGDDKNAAELFFEAVADVRPFHASTKKPAKPGSHPLQKKTVVVAQERDAIEEESFLEEISRLKLDKKFSDSLPDNGELQPLSGNRLRQLKRGVISVNHQLDLHGLSREEALAALPGFLLSARQRGQKAVLVITGKGNHSAEEPVLQQAVASWLRDAGRTTVLEFTPAPREMGGSGAYVVFLRQLPPPP